jgi:hypothetical protein
MLLVGILGVAVSIIAVACEVKKKKNNQRNNR